MATSIIRFKSTETMIPAEMLDATGTPIELTVCWKQRAEPRRSFSTRAQAMVSSAVTHTIQLRAEIQRNALSLCSRETCDSQIERIRDQRGPHSDIQIGEGIVMHTNAVLLQQLFSSLNQHNHEAMAGCYHSKASFTDIAFD